LEHFCRHPGRIEFAGCKAAQTRSRCRRGPKPAVAEILDPQKNSDIRSLLELIGARDMIQEAANNSTEQYRQKINRSRAQ